MVDLRNVLTIVVPEGVTTTTDGINSGNGLEPSFSQRLYALGLGNPIIVIVSIIAFDDIFHLLLTAQITTKHYC